MVQLFHFPERPRAHRISPRHRVKFPVGIIQVVRHILDGARYEDCYLERIADGRMAVDHAGNMFAVFPSADLALVFTDELQAQGTGTPGA